MDVRQPFLHTLAVTVRAPVVCLAGSDGQIRTGGAQGVLAADVRVLSRAVVTVDGVEAEPVAHHPDGASAEHAVGVLRAHGEPGPDPTVWLRRDRHVHAEGMRETFTLVNRSERALDVEIALAVAADLAAIETIKAGQPVSPVPPELAEAARGNPDNGDPGIGGPSGGGVGGEDPGRGDLGGGGSGGAGPGGGDPGGGGPGGDGLLRWAADGVEARVRAPGAAVDRDDTGAVLRWRVAVLPRSSARRGWSLSVRDPAAVVGPPAHGLHRACTVTADDPRLARLLDRALDDLDALLVSEPDHADVAAAAGAPWYLTLFGRDALWTASFVLPLDVRLAGGTLRALARVQGTRVDPASGEEPGKILHERRRAATAHTGDHASVAMLLPPLYYGTIDATPLWICLLRDAWRWGLPTSEVAALLPHLDAALGWVADYADRDGDGFAEYFDDSGRGLANQGWKDSTDAVRFADGRLASGPVALVEVQGYLYEAALAGAELLDAFGRPGGAGWRARAAALATRFRERFWVADGFPALALDGNKTPVDALTSNIGHLLGTGLLDDAETARIAARLRAPDMASGYGLRTMSSDAGGYSPFSYHCGSVWPHDTAVAMRGLARAGRPDQAAELVRALLAASAAFDGRLPELFAGFGADEVPAPVPYPAACRPQAWAAGAAVAVLQTVLGLSVDVPAGLVTLRPPTPSPVGAISVSGLPLGSGQLEVDVDREGRVTRAVAPRSLRVVVA